ncbi:signal peptidase I [Haloplanus sp. GCM10025708]|uniref:signal peptidase I n=1 Tax=Haloplanus sp. GCM10025708 TaxID=3252679 RepID=UPI0036D26F86
MTRAEGRSGDRRHSGGERPDAQTSTDPAHGHTAVGARTDAIHESHPMNPLNYTARTWLNVLGVVLLVALVVPFVVYSVPQTVGADESYVVLTASMAPAIDPGDVVVVTAVDPRRIRVDDVITHQRGRGEIPVTHRVAEVIESDDGLLFQTRGDANEDPDASPVPAAAVVGVVTLTIPYIGHVVSFVNSQYGFLALVVVPLGVLLITEIGEFVLGMRAPGRDDSATDVEPDDVAVTDATPDATIDTTTDDTYLMLTRDDLTLTSVGLAAFALYSGYVALNGATPLSVTVAVGSATAFLLAVGVRQFGMAPAATPQTDGGTTAADDAADPAVRPSPTPVATTRHIPKVSVDDEYRSLPRVRVDSLADLADLASEAHRPIVEDAADGTYLVVDGDVVYSHGAVFDGSEADSSGDDDDAAADSDGGERAR